MKITPTILHIPPHLSTSWVQVRALYLKETDLIVSLLNGDTIAIPGLTPEIRDTIFGSYAVFLEAQQQRQAPTQTHSATAAPESPAPFHLFQVAPNPHADGTPPLINVEGGPTLRFGMESMDSISSAMQHNIAQANMPSLPKEILHKIAEVARIVAPEDIENMPLPEPHCNCTHCQIARAIHKLPDDHLPASAPALAREAKDEEEVSEEDLAFQTWEIVQTAEKLYLVSNRLDPNETYNVFLGDPVGCTCGKQGCEHILAVLKS